MTSAALVSLLAEPSRDHLRELCNYLDGVEHTLLPRVLSHVLEELGRWPNEHRHASVYRVESPWTRDFKARAEAEHGPLGRWLWELFDGVADPRLAVLRSAWLHCEIEYAGLAPWRDNKLNTPALVLAFGKHFAPDFSYPDTHRGSERELEPDRERTITRYGDEQRGLIHTVYSIEHAADSTYGDNYRLYGLGSNTRVELDLCSRSRLETYTIDLSGPTPAVLDAAIAWGELLRAGPQLVETETIAAIARRRSA
jgi:hypothetical protein